MDKTAPQNVKLYYGEGNARLEFEGSPALIEIYYRGKMSLHKTLGRDWVICERNGRIIMFSKTTKRLKSGKNIFKYNGEFKPSSCKVVGWNLETTRATTVAENIHYWNSIDIEFGSLDIKWNKLENTYKKGSPKKTRYRKLNGAKVY